MKTTFTGKKLLSSLLLALSLIILVQCTGGSGWQKKNKELIKQYSLTGRERTDIPKTKIVSNLEPGKVTDLDSLPVIALHPGVSAKLYWASGKLVSVVHLDPDAQIPEESLEVDRFVFVMEGEIDQLIEGNFVNMKSRKREAPDGTHSATARIDFVYLEKGSKNALKAGPAGAKIVEVYSPVRLDYLKKTGVADLPSESVDIEIPMLPSIKPNMVYDIYDLQLAELVPGASSRIITGKNSQVSFIAMEPSSVFDRHIHPEDQLMLVLRGGCSEIILDGEQNMVTDDVLFLPANMVHGANIGPLGCDAIDIFWPARPDYDAKAKARNEAYHSIIPEGTKPELIIDGSVTKPALTFTEGPKWMNGKLYFSNMYFDQAWNGSPAKSSLVEMDPDGKYRNISSGKMQTNGLAPYKNGNLAVCDMMGHRVVEMTTKGQVVKVLADKYDGKKLDGPNDLVVDAKGGIYFTDPQFTADAVKNQPGRCVYYLSTEGKLTRVIEPNDFAMPNGCILTPDGKTLLINNTYDDETWYPVNSNKENFVWAYDVKEDGTLSNGRQFAKLFLTEDVLDRKGKSTSADGMAIDKNGNLYVGTYAGVQIFNSKGEFVGIINLPSFPVSVCFGGDDMKTLYIVSYSKVYQIRTNMEGYMQVIN
jgi:gluconolactonase